MRGPSAATQGGMRLLPGLVVAALLSGACGSTNSDETAGPDGATSDDAGMTPPTRTADARADSPFILPLKLPPKHTDASTGHDAAAGHDAGKPDTSVLPREDGATSHDARTDSHIVFPWQKDGGEDSAKPDSSHPHDAGIDHQSPPGDATVDTAPPVDAGADASSACVGQEDGTECTTAGEYGECCGGVCSNPLLDSNNCGQCGLACLSTQYCNSGQCPVQSCVTGDNGMLCVDEFEAVADGGMIEFEAEWASCCGDSCTELSTDPLNCGTCGHTCPASSSCVNYTCTPPTMCVAGNSGAVCPLPEGGAGTCCSGTCTAGYTSDPNNCGACGVTCPAGVACVNSYCAPPDGGAADAEVCPAGTVRDAYGSCVVAACPAGVSGVACLFGNIAHGEYSYSQVVTGTCCNGVCAYTDQDPNNCGKCGTVCASGVCTTGQFGEPAACIPVPTAPPEFSMCASPSLWVGSADEFGGCIAPGCTEGPQGYCALNQDVGICVEEGFGGITCVDLTDDPNNCGGQGIVCPSGQTCTAGVCSGTVAPCGAGRNGAYCSYGDAGTSEICCAGGGCTDVMNDPNNCGDCGNACTTGLSCIGGHCEVTSCAGVANQTPCGTGATDECCGSSCVDPQTDPNNCGYCGTTCSGAETCVGGLCAFAACTAELQGDPCHLATVTYYNGDCCGLACVDTTSDPNNCGGCNLPCSGTCQNSSCQNVPDAG